MENVDLLACCANELDCRRQCPTETTADNFERFKFVSKT